MIKLAIFVGGSYGDIIDSTPITKYLKERFPEKYYITWYISEYYKDALKNNPFIDEIITFNSTNKNEHITKAYKLYLEMKNSDQHDKYITLSPTFIEEWNAGHHISKAKCLAANRQLNLNIKWPEEWKTVMELTEEEIQKTNIEIDKYKVNKNKSIVFECCPESGQSIISSDIIIKMCKISRKYEFQNFVSSPPTDKYKDIAIVPNLSVREMAYFTSKTTLFVSSSSALAVILKGKYGNNLDKIEFSNSEVISTFENKYFTNNTNEILKIFEDYIKRLTTEII